MSCDCIEKANRFLAENDTNTALDIPNVFRLRIQIATIKLDPSKRASKMPVIAAFCPFCGVRYADEPAYAHPDQASA